LTDVNMHILPASILEFCPQAARITAVHRERYEVYTPYGEACARLKSGAYQDGRQPYPTVGDFVRLAFNPSGDSQILETLPRRSFFARRDPTPGRGQQAVAANFDYVFVTTSLNQEFNLRRLERYLSLALQSGAQPVVILTKADLCPDVPGRILAAETAACGAPVHAISTLTGQGMEALAPYLEPGRVIVLAGSSGVGKSSLINALCGQQMMQTGGIREDDSRGRHTTVHRQMLQLPGHALIIDTPGMREMGMYDAGEGVGEAFAEIEALAAACRFADCSHTGEPGCAVCAAVEAGALSPERLESYRKLSREAHFGEDKGDYLRRKSERNKAIAKSVRAIEKHRKHR